RSDSSHRSVSPPFHARHLPPVALTAPNAARAPPSARRPRASTRLPGRSTAGSRRSATRSDPGGMRNTARSVPRSRPTNVAGMRLPSGSVTAMSSSCFTVPSVVTTTPSFQCTPVEGKRGRACTATTEAPAAATASASWSDSAAMLERESVTGSPVVRELCLLSKRALLGASAPLARWSGRKKSTTLEETCRDRAEDESPDMRRVRDAAGRRLCGHAPETHELRQEPYADEERRRNGRHADEDEDHEE